MIFEMVGLEDNFVAINADDIRGIVEVEPQFFNCTEGEVCTNIEHKHPKKACKIIVRDVLMNIYVKDEYEILVGKWKKYINGVN